MKKILYFAFLFNVLYAAEQQPSREVLEIQLALAIRNGPAYLRSYFATPGNTINSYQYHDVTYSQKDPFDGRRPREIPLDPVLHALHHQPNKALVPSIIATLLSHGAQIDELHKAILRIHKIDIPESTSVFQGDRKRKS